MKKLTRILLLVLLAIMILSMFSACTRGNEKFDNYYIEVSVFKQRYLIGDQVTVNIIENKGSPQGYNIYQKQDDGDFELQATISALQPFSIVFTEAGLFTIKVIPILDGVEMQAKSESLEFLVIPDEEIILEDIVVVNNIIDLYYNSDNDSFFLSDLEIVYYPGDATDRNLSFSTISSDNIAIVNIAAQGENPVYVIQAIGYDEGDPPFIVSLFQPDNPQVRANVYVRVKNDDSVEGLTDFYVGYPQKDYYHDDWVSFQCIEYANMEEADGYAVYRVNEGVETLIPEGDNLQIETYQNGNKVYKVKVTEPEGFMNLRFYAIIDSTQSDVSYDVEVELSDPIVTASSIVIDPDEITLLLDQTYEIEYTILPVDTYDKSVTYEILDDGEDYLSIDDGEIIPDVATDDPVRIKIISNSDEDVFGFLDVNILDFRESDITITHSKPLEQTIGSLEDITFNVSGINGHSCHWYVDGNYEGVHNSGYTYSFNLPERARDIVVSLEIEMHDEDFSVERDFIITLNSVLTMEGLLSEYQLNSEVEFEYVSDLPEPTSVNWRIYTSAETFYDNVSGNTYLFDTAGTYKVKGTLSYDGSPVEEKYSHNIYIAEEISHELYNINVNGYYDGVNYAPHIKWMKTKADADFVVNIRKGSQNQEYDSTDPLYSSYFTPEGFKVPYAELTLEDDFDYRIKTSISERFTGFYSYGEDNRIESGKYSYLDDIDGVMNFYINNVYDLGKLLNYLQVFKPSSLMQGANIVADIYFAIDYDTDVNKAVYERGNVISSQISGGSAEIANASKLIQAASKAYGAGIGMTISYTDILGGGVRISLEIPDNYDIEETMEEIDDDYTLLYDIDRIKSATGRGVSNDVFPIDLVEQTLSVTTSNELFLAATWGIRPIPVVGSVAEGIYNQAKAILNEITDDSMNDIEKANAIYDYLAATIVYDNALYDYYLSELALVVTNEDLRILNEEIREYKSFHLEGVFQEQVAVCDGISKAFALLCAIENIPAMKISGLAYQGVNPINHAWNNVMLEGNWYYVDATWGRSKVTYEDDLYIGVSHYYFKSTSDVMDITHEFYGEMPIVTDEKLYYSYKEYNPDLYFETQAEFESFSSGWDLIGVTEGQYIGFVIDFEYPSEAVTLRNYIENNLPSGMEYQFIIDIQDNYVNVWIFV